jgi:hypothetical protein
MGQTGTVRQLGLFHQETSATTTADEEVLHV